MEIDRYMPDKSLIDYETNSYILNTSYNNDVEAHTEMLKRNIVVAYASGWKEKIDNLQLKDRVFLYKSGSGIVASGIVNSSRKKEKWYGVEGDKYYVELTNFKDISDNPISPTRMKEIRGYGYPFRTTMYSIDEETSLNLKEEVDKAFEG